MTSQRKTKLYLTGPEVFLPEALAYAEQQRALCEHYGFAGYIPSIMDQRLGNGAWRRWRVCTTP
jgi:nucleoside 2-deoxyribosyltransferase